MSKLSLFSIHGRIRRRTYVLFSLLLGIIGYVSGEFFSYSYDPASIFFSLGALLLTFVLYVFLVIKRLHDIGIQGINWLVILIPALNVGFSFWLMLKKGEVGANQYGNDPRS